MSERSYGQHCGLAAALDVVGSRWTMLIVRELFAGPLPFNELARCLAGISTALLSRRLRDLQAAGLVVHEEDGSVYRLTDDGRGLGPAFAALGVWGGRRLPSTTPERTVDARLRDPLWTLQMLAAETVSRASPRTSSAIVNVEVDGRWFHLAHGGAAARRGPDPDSQASVRIGHDDLESIRTGSTTLEELARAGRADIRGDRRAATRAFPHDARTPG